MVNIMTKIKKRRIRYDRILIVLIIIVGSFFLIRSLSKKELKDTTSYMPNLIGLNINDGIDKIKKYNFEIEKEYIYDETDKDTIIEQSIKENTKIDNQKELIIKISKGKIDKEKLKQDNINELGKIPIMMYHGIVDKKNSETDYIGGNVDKDGYTRTSEAFRQDLELYYEKGYRMIRISDYIEGKIDVPYGYSPIILTFDDGNANNLKVTGLDENGNIIIDKNSAVGILEEFKKKYPDYNVTAIFFVTNNLFNQPEYNEKILSWLVDNGYEVGNHTKGHDNFKNILSNNIISKKGDIFVYNTARIDMKTIYALDILCKYKNRYRYFHRGFDPVYITFLSKENLLYNIIVTDKSNEKGILKLLKINSPAIPEADRFILLFKDDSCLNNIVCNTQFAYCVYPDMKILNKRKK